MAAKINFTFSTRLCPVNSRVEQLLAGCAHYQPSDLPLFIAGYNELCRLDLNGGKILEVCCGVGELAREMARAFPTAEVTGMDRYEGAGAAIKEARERQGLSNLRYACGDALRLAQFADASLDLIFGQATLHHLAHDTDALRKEFSRVLKPGGRVVFIYEPLGHNPIWAMVRAWRIARIRMVDESNIFVPQIEQIAEFFTACDLQVFNLLAYPLKFLGRFASRRGSDSVHRADSSLMKRWPSLAPLAANFNVVFAK